MHPTYISSRASDFLWVMAFIMIAIITVTTCIRQEKIMAEKLPVVIAMKAGNSLQ